MKKKQIMFTKPGTAELWEMDVPELQPDEVLTRMEYTVVSGGTERACLTAMPNTQGSGFPKSLGYCGVGRVIAVGEDVKTVAEFVEPSQ